MSEKTKRHTIRDMAKHKILKTAKKAGLGGKSSSTKQKGNKYVFPLRGSTVNRSSTLASPGRSANGAAKNGPISDDENTIKTEEGVINGTLTSAKATFGKTLDRLTERDYCKDFQRLGLCSKAQLTLHSGGGSLHHRNSSSGFRLSTVNKVYSLCRSYPAVFVVPSKVSDDSLKKVAKSHKHGRFPVITWCSANGALLLRGAGLHVKNVVSRLKKHTKETLGSGSASGLMLPTKSGLSAAGNSAASLSPDGDALPLRSSTVEQERYIGSILALSPTQANAGMDSKLSTSMGSLLSLDSLMLTNIETGSLLGSTGTPEPYRKSSGNVTSPASFANMLRGSGGKTSKTMYSSGSNHFGSLRPAHQSRSGGASAASSAFTMLTPGQRKQNSESSFVGAKDNMGPQTLTRASLYIFGEKGQAKALRLEHKCEFIPIDYPSSHDAKASMKKFLRVTAPSTLPVDSTYSHLKALEESGWLQMVKSLLQISAAVVDLIDIQNSSVAICLEDGWDVTAQISSLVQILLDPYYRTIDGLRMLIEKEWLAFGYKFSHRCNHTLSSASSGFSPIFLVFLDALHQICRQFPAAFEYNDFLLKFLAYHSSSGYFGTFLLDSEADRVEAGLIHFENKPRPRPELMVSTPEDIDNRLIAGRGQGSFMKMSGLVPGGSIWDYIEERRRRCSLFYNFLYIPGYYGVLRPQFCMAALDVWQFYCEDYLSYGSTYDLDVSEAELFERQSEGRNFHDLNDFQSERRVVDLNYDSVAYCQPSAFQALLEEISTLEKDLDLLPHQWTTLINQAHQSLETNNVSFEVGGGNVEKEWARWLNRALHKKSTVGILLKGKSLFQHLPKWSHHEGSGGGNTPHHFVKHNFTAPEHCHVCNRILWGVVKQGLRCTNCDVSCHERCASVATSDCQPHSRLSTGDSPATSTQAIQVSAPSDLKEETENHVVESGERFSSGSVPSCPENRTHEGYLMKKGALLKAWKQRWFVLDNMKHQLRYYDYDYDSHCKGFVDLKDVVGVTFVPSPAGMPKRNDGCFFDVKTNKRVYNFMANSPAEAKDWMDKLQSCLQ